MFLAPTEWQKVYKYDQLVLTTETSVIVCQRYSAVSKLECNVNYWLRIGHIRLTSLRINNGPFIFMLLDAFLNHVEGP
jgi:hypothetical protein